MRYKKQGVKFGTTENSSYLCSVNEKNRQKPMSVNPNIRRLAVAGMLLVCSTLHAERMKRVFMSYDASNGLADNSAQTVKCTKTGRMVITTIGHVNFYDGSNFGHIDPQEENDFPLPRYSGHYHLYFDKHHNLWVKDKRKVTCVDLMKERFYTNVDSVIKSFGMKDKVEDLFGDSNNILWFLSGDKLYCPKRGRAVTIRQKAELHDLDILDDNTLMLFFADGVVAAYDIGADKMLYEVASQMDSGEPTFESSVIYREGRYFYQIRNFQAEGRLMRFDDNTREWRELMSVPYHLNNMILHDDILFVASELGYWEYNPTSGEKIHHEELQLTNGRRLATNVNTIAFDRQGGMWIGTENRGLLYARPFTSPFYIYGMDAPEAAKYAQMMDRVPEIANAEPLGRHVNCKYTDSRGWTWTGLYTGVLLERPGHEPHLFTVDDGMMNEMVHSVIEDDYHDVWAGTSNGVCHFFVDKNGVKRVESFFNRDNLPRESFVNRRAMKLNDGTIVMQTLDHVITFNPKFFHNDSLANMVLYPKLIRMMINGRDVKPGVAMDGRVVLENAITRTWEFTVGYDQNSLSLTFSGLNFLRPTQTYYRFRVKGFKDDWQVLSFFNSDGQVDGHGLLHMPLMGLKPGTYEIEVQASLSPEHWPQEPIVWVVHVEEPWWRTTGLYTLFGALLLLIILINFIIYNKNTRLRMKLANDEAEVLHRITSYAMRCQTFSTEILTPYTLQQNEDQEADPDFARVMGKIVPFIQDCKVHEQAYDMQQLAEVAGVSLQQFYDLMMLHLNDSPRLITLHLRLQKVADMLATTDKPVELIADELGFVSPNYLIASFFHHYRLTPADYRNSRAR